MNISKGKAQHKRSAKKKIKNEVFGSKPAWCPRGTSAVRNTTKKPNEDKRIQFQRLPPAL